jgi:hypothetical protein
MDERCKQQIQPGFDMHSWRPVHNDRCSNKRVDYIDHNCPVLPGQIKPRRVCEKYTHPHATQDEVNTYGRSYCLYVQACRTRYKNEFQCFQVDPQ